MKFQNQNINYYFIVSFLTTILFAVVRYPSLFVEPEIWAELGTNFFVNGLTRSAWDNLWILDYSYLPILQRLLSLLTIKLLNIKMYFPEFMQWLGLLFTAYFTSYINLNRNSNIIESKGLRFLISILLGIGVYSRYEDFTFINFIYSSSLYILLNIFTSDRQLLNCKFILTQTFIFILLLSKPFFVAFLPIYLVTFFVGTHRKKSTIALSSIFGIIACVTQFFIMSTNSSLAKGSLNILQVLVNTIVVFTSTLKATFLIGAQFRYVNVIFLFVLLSIFFQKNRRCLFKKRISKKNSFYFTLLFLSFTSIFITVKTQHSTSLSASDVFNLTFHRWYYISNYFLLIFSFGVISKWAYKKSKWVYKFVVLFYFSTILITSGSLSLSLDPYRDKTKNSFSQWSLYKKQITKEKFCIPINPYPWIMCKNLSANIKIPVKDLFIPENNEYIFTPHNDMSLHGFIFEDNLNNFSVFYETSKNQIKKVTYLNPPDNLYTFAIMPSDSKTIRIDSEVFEKIKNTSMTYW